MIEIKLTMDDLGVSQKIQGLLARAKDTQPAMEKTAFFMWKDVMNHFDRAEGSKGKWAPLKWRKGQPLRDTGNLVQSIDRSASRNRAMVFTNVPYAKYHQEGRTGPWTVLPKQKKCLKFEIGGETVFARRVVIGGIPQREFLWVSKEARELSKRAIVDHVTHG